MWEFAVNLIRGKHSFRNIVGRERRIIRIQYDANESLRNLFQFTGTTIHFIIYRPTTWLCITLHYFGFFYLRSVRTECEAEGRCWVDQYSIQFTDTTVFTTLVVFLFVSYNTMCNRILDKQYFSSQTIVGRITSLAMHSRSVIHSTVDRWNLQRLILAAQNVFYWTIKKADAEHHGYEAG